jgi:integral membrane protein
MAMVVGTGLAIVCFVGIPLQVAGNNKWPWTAVVEIVGTAHGIFYIVYLLSCLDLASRARFRVSQLLGMVCSGFLPLLAFYMERRVTKRVLGLLAMGPSAPPGPAAVLMSAVTRRRLAQPTPERGPEEG